MSVHLPSDRASIEQQMLAAYLADRDVACTKCRYNLRGLASGACPECGEAIKITASEPAAFDNHDSLLAEFLESHDAECPACRYSLRHLRTTRCPECSLPLRIVIGPVLTTRACFLAGFAGLASAFGFSVLTLLWVLVMTVVWGPGPPGWGYFALVLMVGAATALMVVWWRQGVRFSKSSYTVRSSLAIAAWLVPLVYLLIFMVMLFQF